MDKRQEAYLSMANKTSEEMKRQYDIWKTNKIISGTMTTIENLIVKIGETDQIKQETTKGYTKKKDQARKQLNTTTDVFCGIFRSYCKTVGDEANYENFNLTPSEIKQIKDNIIMETVNRVKDFAVKNFDKLGDYGMEQKMIDDYGKEALGYINYFTAPQQLSGRKKEATEKLKVQFKELDIQFTEYLDNHMVQYKTKNSDFYNTYLNMREIYDAGSFAISLRGKIIDEETKQPIEAGAVTIIRSVDGKDVVEEVVHTTAKGNYQSRKHYDGMVKVIVECPNYDTWTGSARIIKSKSTILNVAIRKTE